MEANPALEYSKKIPIGTPKDKVNKYGMPEYELGSGTYGTVTKHGQYAIKTMSTEGITAAMLRELACTLRLSHPNVIDVVDVFIIDRVFGEHLEYTMWGPDNIAAYMVMPLATGTLYDIVKDKDDNDYDPSTDVESYDVRSLAYQIVSGVGYCLSRDVLNRDIKVENILAFRSGDKMTLKIADFGLARSNTCSFDTGMTEEVYTLSYRPPEVILGGRYKNSADIWAVGCVLYYLFTGYMLFRERTPDNMLRSMSKEFGPLQDQWKDIVNLPAWTSYNLAGVQKRSTGGLQALPADIKPIITSLLHPDPNQRPTLAKVIRDPYFDPVRDQALDSMVEDCSCNSVLVLRDFPRVTIDPKASEIYEKIELWMANILKYHLRSASLSLEILETQGKLSSEDTPLIIANACMSLAIEYLEVYIPNINFMMLSQLPNQRQLEIEKVRVFERCNFDLFRTTSADYLTNYTNIGRYDETTVKVSTKFLPIVHAMLLALPVNKKEEAIIALFMACTHTECSFKHTSLLTKHLSELTSLVYTKIKASPHKKDIEDILDMPIDEIKTTTILRY
jgi:serine/threonine protein kinase